MNEQDTPLPPSDFAPVTVPRNDGLSVHHRAELEAGLARAQTHLEELKILAGLACAWPCAQRSQPGQRAGPGSDTAPLPWSSSGCAGPAPA
jgi:hypothetical protein